MNELPAWFHLWIGIHICGYKYPFNRLLPDDTWRKRNKAFEDNYGLFEGARLADAWRRLKEKGRYSHDVTNLVIEWVRNSEVTDDEGETISLSGAVKFLCSFYAYTELILLVNIGVNVYQWLN